MNISTVFNRIFQENLYFRISLMARFGPRADGPPIFGPGLAGPIYKRRIGPKWADGPSRAPEKSARAGPRTEAYSML